MCGIPLKSCSLVLLFFAVLGLSGCGTKIIRMPVPGTKVEQALPMGISGVRDWADEYSPVFQKNIMEQAKLYLNQHPEILKGEGELNVLALSGGGADGAFGAGFLKGWTERGDRPGFRVVTGVSTGALIAPFAFLGPEYDSFLEKMYTTMTPSKIYIIRSIFSIFGSDSVADTTPLLRLVEQFVDQKVLDAIAAEYKKGRTLWVATTNLDAKRGVLWDMGAIASSRHPNALKLFRQVMVASASVPAVFSPQYIPVQAGNTRYDEMHVDGGTVSPFAIYGPVLSLERLRQESGINVERKNLKKNLYIILNNRLNASYESVKPRLGSIASNAISTMIRSQAVGEFYKAFAFALRDGMDMYITYIPEENYPERKEEFDPKAMRILFDEGYRMGKAGDAWKTAPPGYTD